uniref:Uncharacterized protein n=1 Tax=Romanomermis culicivorax TaxID=13658 RepID=A0A915K2A3_ROMCU
MLHPTQGRGCPFSKDHRVTCRQISSNVTVHWFAQDAGVLTMMPWSSLLKGIDLYDLQPVCPESLDSTFGLCPNLRFFSVNLLNGEQMRELAWIAPNLQHFRLRVKQATTPILDDLIYLVENLPNLRQLFIVTIRAHKTFAFEK